MKGGVFTSEENINYKRAFGEKLKELRGNISQRELAKRIGSSNMSIKYFEDGVTLPTPEVYEKIVNALLLNDFRNEIDHIYMCARGTPPPDVCKIIIKNEPLNNVLRKIGDSVLTIEQIEEINNLIKTFDLNQGEETDG